MSEQVPGSKNIETIEITGQLTTAAAAAVEKLQKEHSETIWKLFPDIAARVQETYAKLKKDEKQINHHDFAHAKRVGEIARKVAGDEWKDEHLSHLSGIAGLVHNADRTIQAEKGIGRRDVQREDVIARVKEWIANDLEETDVQTVVEAVLGHDGKNSDQDSKVKVALQDGDRIVNLDIDLFPRSGQFYSDLPVIDYDHFLDDPEATYRNPKTVLRDMSYSLDWVKPESGVCVRTKLGLEMAQRRAAIFKVFFDALKLQLAEEGITVS